MSGVPGMYVPQPAIQTATAVAVGHVAPAGTAPMAPPAGMPPMAPPAGMPPMVPPGGMAPMAPPGGMAPMAAPVAPNGVQAVAPVPANYGAPAFQAGGESGSYQFMAMYNRILIKQRFEALEALAGAVGFDFIEFSNKYDIFDANTGMPIMYAAEESNCLCRACCAPNHSAKINFFDVRQGQNAPVWSMDKPFKCNGVICCDICAKSQTSTATNGNALGSAKQPICGGGCTPTVDVKGPGGNDMYSLSGPFCCIGGFCVEACVDQTFAVKSGGNQVGRMVHMKPSNVEAGLKEFAGDSDSYLLEMNNTTTPEDMANLASTLMLIDYIFFEYGGGIECKADGSMVISLCNCYCFGEICPCQLEFNPAEAVSG